MSATSLLTIEWVPINQLRPDPANPRRIGRERLDSPRPPVGRPHGHGGWPTSAPSLCVRTAEFREKSRSLPMLATPTGDGAAR